MPIPRTVKKLLVLGFLGSFSLSARAETSLHGGIELVPQYRHLNQDGFSRHETNYDFYSSVHVSLEVARGDWFFEAKPEIRSVISRGVAETPPDDISILTHRRTLNTRRTLSYREDGESYFDFDRLNVRYTVAGVEYYIGRRPLSLGALRFFPVWNKLTLPLVFEPGPEWIENPDVAGASAQIGSVSLRGFVARGDEPKVDDIALGEVRYFGQGFEVQGLAGYWWERAVNGVLLSFDLWDWTFRSETLLVYRKKDDPSEIQTGFGIEGALSSKWTVVAESFYQSRGLVDVKNVLTPPSRFMTLSGRFYALPYLVYQLHPLWKLNGGLMVNLDNETSFIGLGGFEYSASDNTTLTLKIKWPFGIPEGEFGDRRFEDLLGRTQGLASTVFLSLQTYF